MIDLEKEQLASELRGSYLEFCKTFFPLITGRVFIVSRPTCRESHHITIARSLTSLFRGECLDRLGICVPPRAGKSIMVSLWIAWCFTHFPDCNFIYISYSHDLAAKHTEFIKRIMTNAHYQYLFGVEIRKDSRAKDKFLTTAGGSVAAFGSGGAIVGQDAGLPALDRFTGAVLIDDPHKLDEAHSDTIREGVINNYKETIAQRAPKGTPIVFIGQRAHEADLAAFLQSDNDVKAWEWIILKSIDSAGNALYPEVHPLDLLLEMEKKSPYVFSSQFQQDPLPAGGGLFRKDWFYILDEEPEMLCTFITADTAETDKSWNDATVFSFWGLYEIETMGKKTGTLGLHWLDCQEMRIEPKDLEGAFLDFFANCSNHTVPPQIAAIEKKSTGVTLVSVLDGLRGLSVRKIDRSRASGSKTQRFIDIQSLVSSGRVSFPKNARHNEICLTHMSRITANNTHRHDDIADTLADALKLAFIDKTIYSHQLREDKSAKIVSDMNQSFLNKRNRGLSRYG